jgi:hypothetical protein
MSEDRRDPVARRAGLDRREFLRTAGAASLAAIVAPVGAAAFPAVAAPQPESLVKSFYESLSTGQQAEICFPWNHVDDDRGLLRTRVSANWHITEPTINSDFYTADQRAMIRGIFDSLIEEDWHERFDQQLEDDAGGFGEHQNVAVFGSPGDGPFEFVMTGRHMTLRCDADSTDHVAFGGPIFYGHAVGTWWSFGFFEEADHEGNVFWPQAVAANDLYSMLDGRQRVLSLVGDMPAEHAVGFRGASGSFPGIPLSEFSSDQREEAQRVLRKLIEPFRQNERDEVVRCLAAQGGLDRCSLAFYEEGDIGGDGVWDSFRLEGPAFVWYFRGSPHVHVWVNVADEPTVELNA